MPHLIVEYSANLERHLDIPHLVAAVHAAALETGVFPIGGIRTRAARRDIYAVADRHPDNGRAHRVARDLEAGMIWINSENVRHLPTPFGGMKASGIGRDGGDYSFDFYMETKNVAVAYDTHKVPKIGV